VHARNKTILHIVTVAILLVVIAISLTILPVQAYLARVLNWVESTGPWGPLLLSLAYVLACVLFVPGSVLTLGAGFLFGVFRGTVIVSISSLVGASAAFVIGRTLLRGPIERRVAKYPRFQAIDRAVGEEGFKIVLLTRLSPIFPFNLLNYAYGLTSVSLWQFVAASWIGMLPGTVLYVYLGSALKSLAEVATGSSDGETLRTVFFGVGLVMTLVATAVIMRVASRALNEAVASHAPSAKPSPDARTSKRPPPRSDRK
jgi:uncharacterized membrane protein YdjX (TVP38/TMEM64 family)